MATFMAKWSMDYPGQSGHFHFSLVDEQGANRFRDAAAEDGMSASSSGRRWPVWKPTLAITWRCSHPPSTATPGWLRAPGRRPPPLGGVENRTAAIRVIGGGSSSQRIECRVCGADANPYLAAAGTLAAMWQGIEDGLEPSPPVAGNAYEAEEGLPPERRFPGQLRTAADRLDGSSHARRLLGDAFVDHFAMTRRWECREYERHVNDWQLERYFEII